MKNEIFFEIADLCINQKSTDYGLLYGNAGICIFLLNLSRSTKNKYKEVAEKMVEEVLEHQYTTTSTSFDRGLAGIGWFVEYIVENKFFRGNTDSVLSDIDTQIFKFINNQDKLAVDLQQGLLGYLEYYLSRIKNKNIRSFPLKLNIELCKEIINKIYDMTSDIIFLLTNDIRFDILYSPIQLLRTFKKAIELDLYSDKIMQIVKQWILIFNTHMPNLHSNRLNLAINLHEINEYINDVMIYKIVDNLLFSIDRDIITQEIDLRYQNVQLGWVGIAYLLTKGIHVFHRSQPNYENLIAIKRDILERNDIFKDLSLKKSGELQPPKILGLCNGLAGIGLLKILNPLVFE